MMADVLTPFARAFAVRHELRLPALSLPGALAMVPTRMVAETVRRAQDDAMRNTRENLTQMKMLPLFTLLLLLGALAGGQAQEKKPAGISPPAIRYKDADVAEFARLVADTNNIVLDVRTPREYASGHLAGAMNLNLRAADFATQAARLDKGRTYLVHCAVGARSASACQAMSALGFTNLVNLKTGIQGWEAAGQPVQH